MDKKRATYLYFSYFDGIGPMRFQKLRDQFGSEEKIINGTEKDLIETIGPKYGADFFRFIHTFDAEKELRAIEAKNITILTLDDPRYPQTLTHISDPPICLFVKGDLKRMDLNEGLYFSIVGTRQPTPYGKKVAYEFAQELGEQRVTIVSGLALGIDAAAHMGAMEKGKTIAVLGCGVDIPYPPANRKIYEQIVDSGGLAISEFPPGHTVMKGLFVARNRIISGLSRGTLIVEGAKDSGALITARYAGEQGKDVFAVPSSITSPMGFAPNFLIREGARIATSVEDIFEELDIDRGRKKRSVKRSFDNKEEELVFFKIVEERCGIDDLVISLNIPFTKLVSLLTNLELKAYIHKNGEGIYEENIHI